jgi:hypothetical protein
MYGILKTSNAQNLETPKSWSPKFLKPLEKKKKKKKTLINANLSLVVACWGLSPLLLSRHQVNELPWLLLSAAPARRTLLASTALLLFFVFCFLNQSSNPHGRERGERRTLIVDDAYHCCHSSRKLQSPIPIVNVSFFWVRQACCNSDGGVQWWSANQITFGSGFWNYFVMEKPLNPKKMHLRFSRNNKESIRILISSLIFLRTAVIYENRFLVCGELRLWTIQKV